VKKRERKNEQHETRAAADSAFQERFPYLFDHITARCWDGDPKQPRVTSTLLVFAGDGCWKACLRDRAEGLCCWVAAPGFDELLAVLERELGDGTAVWRLDRLAGHDTAKRPIRGKGA
jgi:hypothetical protein